MRPREEVRQEVARRMTVLDDHIYNEHRRDADKTYISVSEHRRMCDNVREMRKELQAIGSFCRDEYFVVAPDRRVIVEGQLQEIERALDKYHREVSRVFGDNPYETEYVEYHAVPVYRPINDSLCRLARQILGIHPVDRQYVGQKPTPVIVRRVGT